MIEVITGPMFSGKTEELIKRIKKAQDLGLRCAVFKPEIESRNEAEINAIATHNKKDTFPAIVVRDLFEILDLSASYDLIAIDEAQFFSENIYRVVSYLSTLNKVVLVSGLDLDYKKEPFNSMGGIMAIADSVTKLLAVCDVCGSSARYSKRTITENDRVLIGSNDKYIATCLQCYVKNSYEKNNSSQD